MIDRYLAIVAWARKRYTRDGRLVISVGMMRSRYSAIEDLAWKRYMEGRA